MATIIRVGGVPSEGNATPADVIAGKTFSNDSDTGLTGTLKRIKKVYVTSKWGQNGTTHHDTFTVIFSADGAISSVTATVDGYTQTITGRSVEYY